jgi:hypothetical protein
MFWTERPSIWWGGATGRNSRNQFAYLYLRLIYREKESKRHPSAVGAGLEAGGRVENPPLPPRHIRRGRFVNILLQNGSSISPPVRYILRKDQPSFSMTIALN